MRLILVLPPLSLLAALGVLSMQEPPAPRQPSPFAGRHAIVFGIDGLRSDALRIMVENGRAPHIASLIANGAVT